MEDYTDAEYKYGSVLDIPFADNTFDMVSCIELIEHMHGNDAEKAVSELSRVLQSGGYAIIATPNYDSKLWNIIERAQLIIQPGQWTSDHYTHFNRSTLNELCGKYGLKEIRYNGIQKNMDMVITYQKTGG